MFGTPRPQHPQIRWGYRPPYNHRPQWINPGEPRVFLGQRQRFHQPRQPFQPGNDNFWCETCDRGFPTEDVLNKHKQQHQKCNIDGCQFIAHPKVITKHIQMQHSTGLYKKIANLKNPEEIEKWREERRKRYPTKSNIDKKAAELKEKTDRGEKMGLERQWNHRNKQSSENDNESGQGFKRRSNTRYENQPAKVKRNNPINNNLKKPQKTKTKQETTSNAETNRLKPFAGILNLEMDSDNEIENDNITIFNDIIQDDDEDCKESVNIDTINISQSNAEPVVCGALSTLMCDYGSSDEEDNSNIVIKTDIKQLNHYSEYTRGRNQKPDHVEPAAHKNHILKDIKCETNTAELINVSKNTVESYDNIRDENLNIGLDSKPNKDSIVIVQNVISTQNKTSSTDLNSKVEEDTGTISTTVDNSEIKSIDNNDNQADFSKPKNLLLISQISESINCDKQINKDSVQKTIPNGDDSDSGPEETTVEKRKDDTYPVTEGLKPKDARKKTIRGRIQNNQWRRRKIPSTLLQKLLFKEMQQERNIVLQCIRYIRRNNYFDKKE